MQRTAICVMGILYATHCAAMPVRTNAQAQWANNHIVITGDLQRVPAGDVSHLPLTKPEAPKPALVAGSQPLPARPVITAQKTVPHDPFSDDSRPATPSVVSAHVNPPAVLMMTSKPLPAQVWTAQTGKTLRDVLFTWSANAFCSAGRHWSVEWVTPVNYRIDAPLTFTGSWRDALTGIFKLYERAAVPLYAGTNTPQCIVKVDSKPAG